MPKETTPSFVVELHTQTTSADERDLLVALEAGRMLYNACIGEALKRLDLMRESKTYAKVRKIRKIEDRTKAFKALREQYGFKDSAIQSFAIKTKNSAPRIGNHLDAHTTQKVATRAFNASNRHALGKGGRPRFKGKGQFDSLEGKTNANGIRYREGFLLWRGLEIACKIDPKDEVVSYGLLRRTKYCRIVRRKINGKNRFYVQLIVEGLPYQKEKNRPCEAEVGALSETIGVDVGPSTIAYVGETKADLRQFCSELEPIEKEIRQLQQAMDRSRRASNSGNYKYDGQIRKGKKIWIKSARYKAMQAELADLQRRRAAFRKTLHGQMQNEIIRIGTDLHIENNSYESFQKNYGRSVGNRAPGMFVTGLIRKAERAGGEVWDIAARALKMSQLCKCGRLKKKKLSERWHRCECGAVAQRDLFSAFLARCAEKDENGKYILDTSRAERLWHEAEPLMSMAVSRICDQSASGRAFPASFGLKSVPPAWRQSGSPAKPEPWLETRGRTTVNSGDAVVAGSHSCGESPEKAAVASGRIPSF